MKNRWLYILCVSLFCLQACQKVASDESNSTQITQTATSTAENPETNVTYFGKYDAEDLQVNEKKDAATQILFGEKVQVEGEGATVDGTTVTITEAGTYWVSGQSAQGQLKINVAKEAKVALILADLTLTNPSGPAIFIEQAEKVLTTLADQTVNTLSDGSAYQLAENESEPDATFYSKEDLTINGTGKLIIKGQYNHGIRSKDDLVLVAGTYDIQAKNSAIKGKDSVSIRDGAYHLVTTEGDGIQANNSEAADKGWVAIDGGTFTIQSARDGVQAETTLSAQRANMTIQTADGAQTTILDTTESYKGLKAKTNLLLASGTYQVDSADDSLHANGDIEITSGTLQLASGDDGIHADQTFTITDGTLTISQSYEGIEASILRFEGGQVAIIAEDDGVNAGGGNDTEENQGQFGPDQFGGSPGDTVEEDKQVHISGGELTIDSQGDSLDSNGNVSMTGGTLLINGTTRGGNGALDYNGTFDISGGTLIACGSSDMAQNVSSATQGAVGIYFDTTQAAGTLIGLRNQAGETLLAFQPSKSYQHVVISSPALQQNDTYTIVSGGVTTSEQIQGYFQNPVIQENTELGQFTFSQTVVNVTQSGVSFTPRGMGHF